MSESGDISFIDLLWSLMTPGNTEELEEFQADPQGFLADNGFGDLEAIEVYEAVQLLSESQLATFDREFDAGLDISLAPPAAGEDAAEYLKTYITNNYLDEADTSYDNSVTQQIDTGGGDFDQEIDIDAVTASGDATVAVGGNITDSTIVTGNDNLVGDDNQAVLGDDNTTSFGTGDATSTDLDGDLTLDDGAAFTGGDAAVDNSKLSADNIGNESIDNSKDNSDNNNSQDIDNPQDIDNSQTDVGLDADIVV